MKCSQEGCGAFALKGSSDGKCACHTTDPVARARMIETRKRAGQKAQAIKHGNDSVNEQAKAIRAIGILTHKSRLRRASIHSIKKVVDGVLNIADLSGNPLADLDKQTRDHDMQLKLAWFYDLLIRSGDENLLKSVSRDLLKQARAAYRDYWFYADSMPLSKEHRATLHSCLPKETDQSIWSLFLPDNPLPTLSPEISFDDLITQMTAQQKPVIQRPIDKLKGDLGI